MRDLAILAILAASLWLAFYRPWLGVLMLAVFSYLQPQAYASGLVRHFPVQEALFVAVLVSAVISPPRRVPPKDWRITLALLLWAYFLFTTLFNSIAEPRPTWALWPKMVEVSKTFAILALTVFLIDTREKLICLVATIAVSVAAVSLKGGYWAFMTGFSNRVYGPPGGQYYDNNMFAIVAVMAVPLLLFLLRGTADRKLQAAWGLMIVLSIAAALSSWSRGALVTLSVTGIYLLLVSRRRLLVAAMLAAASAFAVFAMTDEWHARMETLLTYERDGSAMSRITAWKAGIAHALDNPLTGGGFDSWKRINPNPDMDWHNSYVEVAAEHGLVALALWGALLLGTISRPFWPTRRRPLGRGGWAEDLQRAISTSLVAYATGSLFLGLSYWDIWLHLVVMSALADRLASEQTPETMRDRARRGGPIPAPVESVPVPGPGPGEAVAASRRGAPWGPLGGTEKARRRKG